MTGIRLVSGQAGVPLGIALHDYVLPRMGAAVGTAIPRVDLEVYGPGTLLALILGGCLMAVTGALLPAGRAARLSTATALRTE